MIIIYNMKYSNLRYVLVPRNKLVEHESEEFNQRVEHRQHFVLAEPMYHERRRPHGSGRTVIRLVRLVKLQMDFYLRCGLLSGLEILRICKFDLVAKIISGLN